MALVTASAITCLKLMFAGAVCRNNTECSNAQLCQENITCSTEGTFPKESSIYSFYTCQMDPNTLELVRNDSTCPEGKYFSREVNTCIDEALENGGSLEFVGEICPDRGYFPDPEVREYFYVCSRAGFGTRMQCVDGTAFSPETTSCTPQARCSDREDERTEEDENYKCKAPGTYADPDNCQIYYKCDTKGRAFRKYCTDGTYYDDDERECTRRVPDRCKRDHSSQGTTSERYDQTTQTSQTVDTDSTATTEDITTETPQETTVGNSEDTTTTTSSGSRSTTTERLPTTSTTTSTPQDDDGNESNALCPDAGYFPDLLNCHLYYFCSGVGVGTPVYCPGDTYYDDETTLCTQELPERCRNPETPSDNYTTTVRITTSENGNDSYTTAVPTEETEITTKNTMTPTTRGPEDSGFICPGEGYYPNPANCQSYYICYDWVDPILVSCPENTFYNEVEEVCTREMPDRCRGTDRPSEEKTTVKNEFETSTPPTKTPGNSFQCPADGYHADPVNCQNYYICYNGLPTIPVSCPNGTFFDESTTLCTNEMPERCRKNSTENDQEMPSTTPMPDYNFKCDGTGYYPDPKDCHRYFVCYDTGLAISITCPNGTYYDDEGEFCSPDIPMRCLPEDTEQRPPQTKPPQEDSKFSCPSSGNFPDPNNCNEYWICFGKDIGYSVKCPNGTYYHEDKLFCQEDLPPRCERPEEEDFTCPGDGYFIDPFDCQTYYYCFWGFATKVRCPENTYFDESRSICACNIPNRCKVDERFVCPEVGFFPDPRDCRRYFACNFSGIASSHKCPKGRYFDEKSQTCTYQMPQRCLPVSSDRFVCRVRGYFADPVNCSIFHVCNSTGAKYTGTCQPNTYYHDNAQACLPLVPERCKCQMDEEDFIKTKDDPKTADNTTFDCPGNGLFPDPEDCRKFYVCYGTVRKVTCRDGFFNDETQTCVKEMPKRCRGGETTETQPSTTPHPEEYTCPGNGLFRDPKNCHRFYVCYGTPRLITCQNNNYFNEETKTCEEEMPEQCREDYNGTSETKPSSTPQPEGFTCPGQGIFADPSDCRKFYVCYGTARQVSCRSGTYFNEETKNCDSERPARCDGDQETSTYPSISTSGPGFQCNKPGRYPDPEDCQGFYSCNWRLEVYRHKCRDNGYFNDVTEKCEADIPERCRSDDDRVRSTTEPPSDLTCPERGNFPDLEDCYRYYYCAEEGSQPVSYTCPEKQYFNKNKAKCKKIKRGDECIVQDTHDRDRDEDRDRDDDDDDDDDDNDEDYFSDEGSEEFVCTRPGLFPDFRDCKKFYECSRELKATHKTCSGRTYFNEILRNCSILVSKRCRKSRTFF
ncbi:UNVERIFIED_CONTAM: hypothetical protein PYX00_002236 [Menopon gallinae]|uniref:Chitin-binding type-2 domain-containing protein n=1 Tax=Menopon gallinae TaxID=328185 RepID=A0AAW2IFN7_9NEOP